MPPLFFFSINDSRSQNCNLVGAWEVLSLTFTDPDGTVREVEITDPPGLKIFSESHWVFVEQNEEDNPIPTSGGGGTYVIDGPRYIETVEYHAARDFIGKTIAFECRAEGDRWYQSGYLPDGVYLEEVYKRAETK